MRDQFKVLSEKYQTVKEQNEGPLYTVRGANVDVHRGPMQGTDANFKKHLEALVDFIKLNPAYAGDVVEELLRQVVGEELTKRMLAVAELHTSEKNI